MKHLMNKEGVNALEATVDRWEGDFVVLRTADGQELIWPGERLPPEVAEGEAVRLVLLTDKEETSERRELAKNILNEIFDTSQSEEK